MPEEEAAIPTLLSCLGFRRTRRHRFDFARKRQAFASRLHQQRFEFSETRARHDVRASAANRFTDVNNL